MKTYSLIFLFILLHGVIHAQLSDRKIFVKEKIKRVEKYYINDKGEKLTIEFSFINDSGLIYKSIEILNIEEKPDTIITYFTYDAKLRMVKEETVKSLTYVYSYPSRGKIIKESKDYREIETKQAVKTYYFKDDSLINYRIARKLEIGKWKNRAIRLFNIVDGNKILDYTGRVIGKYNRYGYQKGIVVIDYVNENQSDLKIEFHDFYDKSGLLIKSEEIYNDEKSVNYYENFR